MPSCAWPYGIKASSNGAASGEQLEVQRPMVQLIARRCDRILRELASRLLNMRPGAVSDASAPLWETSSRDGRRETLEDPARLAATTTPGNPATVAGPNTRRLWTAAGGLWHRLMMTRAELLTIKLEAQTLGAGGSSRGPLAVMERMPKAMALPWDVVLS